MKENNNVYNQFQSILVDVNNINNFSNINELLEIADKQKIFSYLYDHIDNIDNIDLSNKKRYMLYKYRKNDIRKHIGKLHNIFSDNSICYAFIKGNVLSELIFKSDIRQYDDIDILVKNNDLYLIKTLLEKHGYTEIHNNYNNGNIENLFELVFVDTYHDVVIEIKSCDTYLNEIEAEKFLNRRVLLNTNLYTLSEEDTITLLILNAFKNIEWYNRDYYLRDIIDIYYFFKNISFDFKQVFNFFKENDLLEIYTFVLDTVKDLYTDFNYYKKDILDDNNALKHYLIDGNLFLTFLNRAERLQIGKKDHIKYLNQFHDIKFFDITEYNMISLFNNTVIDISLKNQNIIFTIKEFEKIDSSYIYNIYVMNKGKSEELYSTFSLSETQNSISIKKNDYVFKNRIYFYITITTDNKLYMYNNIGYDFIPCIMKIN